MPSEPRREMISWEELDKLMDADAYQQQINHCLYRLAVAIYLILLI